MSSSFTSVPSRRLPRLLLATLAAAALGACNDPVSADEDHADEVSAIRLAISQNGTTTTYTIADNGTVTPSPLRVPTGQSTVSATFLADDGDVLDAGDLADFRLDFPSATGLTFTRTGAFSGTLAATAAAGTSVPVALCLFHIQENHCDLGPWPGFTVTIGG